ISAVLSFAGRTEAVIAPPIPYRIGGFGGAEGLTEYLGAKKIDLLIDATHPFAESISRNAKIAAVQAKIPLAVLSRPPWVRAGEDHWIDAASMADAALALGSEPRRVFLTIGRLQIDAFAKAPQHFYLARMIAPPPAVSGLPNCRLIQGRGPFALEAEEATMRENSVDVLVTKNSGGEAARAKIIAARRLGIPVVMIARPGKPASEAFHDPAKVMSFILRHQSARREV
ncbi:MAG: cobalt-precorrin-6A reductase, partial [Methylocapsa sp.]|nr:cobalt-precorrin-6A reductase [Methylocapsa sp.]